MKLFSNFSHHWQQEKFQECCEGVKRLYITSPSYKYKLQSTLKMGEKGPFGIDPISFTILLLFCLFMFVFYLLLPRGFRVHHFKAYPRRYRWSARTRSARRRGTSGIPEEMSQAHSPMSGHRSLPVTGYPARASDNSQMGLPQQQSASNNNFTGNMVTDQPETVTFESGGSSSNPTSYSGNNSGSQQIRTMYSEPNDEIVISAAMQQLREHGVLIVAHGSRGRPKTVRLQLAENAITWRTETRKKTAPPKLGKLHQVPLAHIMYVDVGKQTTALRRVENAGVPESLCFSLLTKEGSLDLEANSPRERDALVGCFSLVLDEVHAAQNWRDIYRGPSSDMPSSFDDFENEDMQGI